MDTLKITEEIKKNLPPLYSSENEEDPMILYKFFDPTGFYTWYVIEGERQEDGDILFYGYVTGHFGESGYFKLSELKNAKNGITGIQAVPIERDLYFKPCRLSTVRQA